MNTNIRTLAVHIGTIATAWKNCHDRNPEWLEIWDDVLTYLEKKKLPSGSGIDNGCKINRDKTSADRIVIEFGFHHMDAHGFYSGWEDYTAVITPSFLGDFNIRIAGRNRNDIKDYLADLFGYMLGESFDINPHITRCRAAYTTAAGG